LSDLAAYFNEACRELSGKMKPGAYAKLKEAFPDNLRRLEAELEGQWDKAGIDRYLKRMIDGFRKIGECNN